MDSDHCLVVVPLRLKLKRRADCKPGKRVDVELLKQTDTQEKYRETVRKQFENKKGCGSVEERWKKMKHAIMESATQHLQRKRQVRRRISEDTLKIIEEKHQATFGRW